MGKCVGVWESVDGGVEKCVGGGVEKCVGGGVGRCGWCEEMLGEV